ncbi:hypothetical protein DRN75_01280 [Nanoarchaeota archaeon]|nr:MAG: hypothetical protein DRN75_01280 [Nanoarchaeota archaeon]
MRNMNFTKAGTVLGLAAGAAYSLTNGDPSSALELGLAGAATGGLAGLLAESIKGKIDKKSPILDYPDRDNTINAETAFTTVPAAFLALAYSVKASTMAPLSILGAYQTLLVAANTLYSKLEQKWIEITVSKTRKTL